MLDADADLAMRRRLDKPPRLNVPLAIARMRARRKDRGWIRTFLAAVSGPGKLSADEFFYYGLDRESVSAGQARSYVGKRAQHRMHTACNNAVWFAVASDKLHFYTVMAGAGLPTPVTVGLASGQRRPPYRHAPLSAEGLRDLLRDEAPPHFGKPLVGMYSLGSLLIDSVDDDGVVLRKAGRGSWQQAADYMTRVCPTGYLFQRLLGSHPALADLTGGIVPTLRLLIIASAEPTILSATLKLPMASNLADNFWREGNVLAAVDRDTGRLTRAIVSRTGRVPDEVDICSGRSVPDWKRATEITLDAAAVVPGIRTQSWDVALTDHGPVLLELNFGGDLNLHQLAHDRGILNEEYREHLSRCGYKGKLV
jgi:hypothetical protein